MLATVPSCVSTPEPSVAFRLTSWASDADSSCSEDSSCSSTSGLLSSSSTVVAFTGCPGR